MIDQRRQGWIDDIIVIFDKPVLFVQLGSTILRHLAAQNYPEMDIVLIASCDGALQLGSTTLVVVGRWVNVVLGASLSWSSPTAGSNRRQPNSRKAIGLNPIDDS